MSLHTLHWLLQTNKQTKTNSYPDKTYNTSNGQKSYFSGKHFDRHNLSTQQDNSTSFPALYVNLHWISYLCYEFLDFYLFIYFEVCVCVRKHPYVCLTCVWMGVGDHAQGRGQKKVSVVHFTTVHFVSLR